MFLRIPLTIRW